MKKRKLNTKRLILKFILCLIYLVVITILLVGAYTQFREKRIIVPWDEAQSVEQYSYLEVSKMSEKFAFFEDKNIGLHFIVEEERKTDIWHIYVIAINENEYDKYKDIIDYTYERIDKAPNKIKVYGYPSIMDEDLKKLIVKNVNNFLPAENEVKIDMDNLELYLTNSYLDTTIPRKDKFNPILFITLLLLAAMIALFIFTIFDRDKIVDSTLDTVKDVEKKTKKVLRLKIFNKKK